MSTREQAHESEQNPSMTDHPDDHGAEMVIGGVEVGPVVYWKIWAVLLGLLIVSFIGPFAGIRIVTLATAFGIAVVKAYLVCKHFMHLNVQPRFVVYFLVTALVLMALFFFGTAPDVLQHEGTNWTNVAAQEEVARAMAEEHGGEHGGEGAFDATETFEQTCGPCHGTTGHGDGPAAAALDPHPANFADPAFWSTRDREHVIDVITNGGASVGRSAAMAAFGAQFTPEQIEALADHVMSFRPADADIPPAPEPEAPGVEEPAPEGAGAEDGAEEAPGAEEGAEGAGAEEPAPEAAADEAPAEEAAAPAPAPRPRPARPARPAPPAAPAPAAPAPAP